MQLPKGFLLLVAVAPMLPAPGSARAADWPTYRHDNARSGVTEERLELPLRERWVFESPARPARGWSDYRRNAAKILYDDAFHVVSAGNSAFFCSSAENKVYCLDAETGRVRWAFYTGAPPRLAPTVWDGRILAGSDDGRAYCLDGPSGSLLWEFDGAAGRDRALGQGRLMSLWPVRTGVMVDDGVAYLGSGLFPAEGAYLHALNAANGKPLWTSEIGFSPQGYMLCRGDELVVPSGRTTPVFLRREDGHWAGGIRWQGKGSGGAAALLAAGSLYNLCGEKTAAYDADTKQPIFMWSGARRILVHAGTAYLYCQGFGPPESAASGCLSEVEADYSELIALPADRLAEFSAQVYELHRQLDRAARYGAGPGDALKARRDEVYRELYDACLWRLDCEAPDELILARGMLLAGGLDRVTAVDAVAGRRLWSAEVAGRAKGLAVANGRLFVSTTEGNVYCFTSGAGGAAASPETGRPAEASDEIRLLYGTVADDILDGTGLVRGYCVTLGKGAGRLALALAERSGLNVYALEGNPSEVAPAREALSRAGLYGSRVSVEEGTLSSAHYPPYFANLVVSTEGFLGGSLQTPAAEMFRILRPLGGVACVGANASGFPGDWLDGIPADEAEVTVSGEWARIVRGPLPGAGVWTHQHANASNTDCSEDRLAAAPLGILWFGDPGPQKMAHRHAVPPAPLSVNGRLFVQGKDSVMAYDAYNGLPLWERSVPGARRVDVRMEAGNMAATDDSLFIALDGSEECVRLDAATGATLRTYAAPPRADGQARRWAWIATEGDSLFGSRGISAEPQMWTGSDLFKRRPAWRNRSECVFALVPGTGRVRWLQEGADIVNVGIAVGGGNVFFVDYGDEPGQGRWPAVAPDLATVVALDAQSGRERWRESVDIGDCIVESHLKSALTGSGGEVNLAYKDGVLLLSAFPYASKYGRPPGGEDILRKTVALSAADGAVLWSRRTQHLSRAVVAGRTIYAEPWAFDLLTGEQKLGENPSPEGGAAWYVRTGGCGPMAASASALFFRKGSIAWYDLAGAELHAFTGVRPGCGVNFIPANGLVLIPDGSEGCECAYPIKCSLALYPKAPAGAAPTKP